VKWEQEAEVSITLQNLLGETIQQYTPQAGIKEMRINTASLPVGLYILALQNDGERSSLKVEIVR
jgi:hypothetical protein